MQELDIEERSAFSEILTQLLIGQRSDLSLGEFLKPLHGLYSARSLAKRFASEAWKMGCWVSVGGSVSLCVNESIETRLGAARVLYETSTSILFQI